MRCENSAEQYDAGLKLFRDTIMKSCRMSHSESSSEFFIISNFSRQVLGQTGDGHFSPIGGKACLSEAKRTGKVYTMMPRCVLFVL